MGMDGKFGSRGTRRINSIFRAGVDQEMERTGKKFVVFGMGVVVARAGFHKRTKAVSSWPSHRKLTSEKPGTEMRGVCSQVWGQEM